MEENIQRFFYLIITCFCLAVLKLLSKRSLREKPIFKILAGFVLSTLLSLLICKNSSAEVKNEQVDNKTKTATSNPARVDSELVKKPQIYTVPLYDKDGKKIIIKGTNDQIVTKLLGSINNEDLKIRQNAFSWLGSYTRSDTCHIVIDWLKNNNDKMLEEKIILDTVSNMIAAEDKTCLKDLNKICQRRIDKALAEQEEGEGPLIKQDNEKNKYLALYLIRLLEDDSLERVYFYRLIGLLGQLKESSAVKYLIGMLQEDKYRFVKDRIIYALGESGDEKAVAYLISFLNDQERQFRSAAIHSLGQIGSPAALTALKGNLNNSDLEMKWNSAETLARKGEEIGAKVMLDIFNNEPKRYSDSFMEIYSVLIKDYFDNIKNSKQPTVSQVFVYKNLTQDKKLLKRISDTPKYGYAADILKAFCEEHPDYKIRAWSFFAWYSQDRVRDCDLCRAMPYHPPKPILRIEGVNESLTNALSEYFNKKIVFSSLRGFPGSIKAGVDKLVDVSSLTYKQSGEFVKILEGTWINNKRDLEKVLASFAQKLKIKY